METSQINLTDPVNNLGSRKERKGQQEHATSLISFASETANTGALMQDAKESGQEASESPTKLQSLMRSRKGHSSQRTVTPSTRWVRGVKEHPNGEGP